LFLQILLLNLPIKCIIMNALYTPIIKKAIISDTRGDVLAVPIKSHTPETESNDDVAQEKEAVITPTTLSGISAIPNISSINLPAAEESITATANTFSPVYKTNNGKKVIDKEATKKAFVAHFLPIYKKILQDKGISNEYARALVAQAGHESAWGIKPIG
jgi:flagellum-specific peptidoglycan hydrolase FlgJ